MSLQKSFFRGVAFALGFILTLGVTMTGVAFAAGGGIFGKILADIVGVADISTYTGDGTVKNAQKLGGNPATDFQKVTAGQSCSAGQCIYRVETDGTIQCH